MHARTQQHVFRNIRYFRNTRYTELGLKCRGRVVPTLGLLDVSISYDIIIIYNGIRQFACTTQEQQLIWLPVLYLRVDDTEGSRRLNPRWCDL